MRIKTGPKFALSFQKYPVSLESGVIYLIFGLSNLNYIFFYFLKSSKGHFNLFPSNLKIINSPRMDR